MISEKLISIFGLIFITSYVAKYIGVELFGEMALAIVLFQIVQVAAQMGSDNVIFKRVACNPASGMKLIRATLTQRLFIYCSLSVPILLWQYFHASPLAFKFFLAIFTATLFSTLDVYTIYYNARLRSKYNAIVNTIGLFIGFSIRYALVFAQMAPVWLALPIILTTLVPLALRAYSSRKLFPSDLSFHIQRRYQLYLLRAGSSLVIASISVAIYSRIAQLMLAWLAGSKAVGLYTVASSLATSWTFVTAALITSSFTSIFNTKTESEAINQTAHLNRIIIGVSILFIVVVSLAGYPLLKFMYGDEYLSAWPLLILLSFSSLFSSLGPIAYRYIIRMSGYTFLTKKSLVLFIVSVPLTMLFIWLWGVYGAAASMIIIEFMALTIFNYPFARGVIWKIHQQAFNFKGIKDEKRN